MRQIGMIDYSTIGDAVGYYQRKGYKYIEVPWMVTMEAINATIPGGASPLAVVGYPWPTMFTGETNLVGSAEQSFIQLMINGKLEPGKYLAVTPCFRQEANPDKYHLPYFLKVELINFLKPNVIPKMAIDTMVQEASGFFGKYLDTKVNDIDYHSSDIETFSGLELGSYGYREWNGFKWVYGTGLAEPRFSQAYDEWINKF